MGTAATTATTAEVVGPALGYRPALDGLRGVAIAFVIAFHFTAGGFPFKGGFLGVDVCFVLSGFLITQLLVEERARGRGISLRGFYRRRAARLLPAVVAMLAVFAVIGYSTDLVGRPGTVTKGILATLTYTANSTLLTRGHGGIGVLGSMWTPSTEEQFYLLWPLMLIGLLRVVPKRTAGRFVGRATGLFFLWFATRANHPDVEAMYSGIGGHAIGFLLAGCAVALLCPLGVDLERSRIGAVARRYGVLAMIASLPFCLAVGFSDGNMMYARGGFALVTACVVLVTLAALQDTPMARVLASRPLVHIGVLSYSLYLWNYLLYRLAIATEQKYGWSSYHVPLLITALVLTYAAAIASYHLVERPLRRRLAPKR